MKRTELKQIIKEVFVAGGYVDLMPINRPFLYEDKSENDEFEQSEDESEKSESKSTKTLYVLFKKHLDKGKMKLMVTACTDDEIISCLDDTDVYFAITFSDFERAGLKLEEEGDSISISKFIRKR